mmetsp:Transcript_4793/g.11378  ORF Transcript_4793/g.11378 Transcript_4793/m.11378 type:complete len:229 (-) Transcript_4793:6-692(-)
MVRYFATSMFALIAVSSSLTVSCTSTLDRPIASLSPRKLNFALQHSLGGARGLRGGSDHAEGSMRGFDREDGTAQVPEVPGEAASVAAKPVQQVTRGSRDDMSAPAFCREEHEEEARGAAQQEVHEAEPAGDLRDQRVSMRDVYGDLAAPPPPLAEEQTRAGNVGSAFGQELRATGMQDILSALRERTGPVILSFCLGMAVAVGVAWPRWKQEDDLEVLLADLMTVNL